MDGDGICGALDHCTGFDGDVDADGDGVFSNCDCNDDDVTAYPGAPEFCDTIDQDCNGEHDTKRIAGGRDLDFYHQVARGEATGKVSPMLAIFVRSTSTTTPTRMARVIRPTSAPATIAAVTATATACVPTSTATTPARPFSPERPKFATAYSCPMNSTPTAIASSTASQECLNPRGARIAHKPGAGRSGA